MSSTKQFTELKCYYNQKSIILFLCSFVSEESPPLPGVDGDGTKAEGKDGDQLSQDIVPKGKKKKDGKDEIQIEVKAKLGGIGVTVTSIDGDLSHIIVGGE